MKDLARLEKERNIRPSPEIDAFMKASSVGGKKYSVSTDYILKVLGLDVCSETIVGNDMLRGVSGGQRKRVTTGEMIVGPRKTLFMDEISTGLDSSTTFQIVKCLRNFVHLMEATVLMALLQPAPETLELFDDLVLLSEGHVVYQGPRAEVLEFFESLGFRLPPRKGVADFLQEVTSKKDQAQYWADPSKPYEFIPVADIAKAFKNSKFGRSLEAMLHVPHDKSRSNHPALFKTKFAISKWELFKTCFARELRLISRHRFLYIFRTCQVGDFSDDNRSGIDNSLHRISTIRNRKLQIIGLTCRVGRAVSGSAEIIRDLVEGGGSILVIGPPGVGKTTLIREIARMLADEHMKRVVIVDTSNEIGGDGDVPHEGIGRARRMQVPNVNMQHTVMIEAVENHMPETIIIDEIGTELEALAASTIAQRGVQLVGTAHGMSIDNIIKNPSLQILVGGIESVTLGDEEARKRKVQKTILERKGPPSFTCAVEMISRTECRVHHRLDATVDAILAGKSPLFEVRHMDIEDDVSLKSSPLPRKNHLEESEPSINEDRSADVESDEEDEDYHLTRSKKWSTNRSVGKRSSPVCVYTYKILEADLLQVAKVMGLEDEIDVTDDIGAADAILATSSEMKQIPWIRGVAKFYQLPVFVIKSDTMAQMVKALRMILGMESFGSISKQLVKNSFDIEIADDAPKRKPTLEEIDALEEVRLAIEYIVIPGGEPVELLPRRSEIVARQLELVKSYQLAAENSGTEMNPRLQILPTRLSKKSVPKSPKFSTSQKETTMKSLTGGDGGTSVTRLPLLPE